MADNDTQKAVEKSLKRISNQTPNDIRTRLNESLIGFQNRTDIIRATAAQQGASEGRGGGTRPASVEVSETVIPVTSITLNRVSGGDQLSGPSAPGGGSDIDDIIIVFNGTAKYCTLKGTIGADV